MANSPIAFSWTVTSQRLARKKDALSVFSVAAVCSAQGAAHYTIDARLQARSYSWFMGAMSSFAASARPACEDKLVLRSKMCLGAGVSNVIPATKRG
jgi:hypothetical protein